MLFYRLKRQSTAIVWLSIVLFSALQITPIQAAYSIDTDTTCSTCLGASQTVCRASYYDRYAYCCDETEIGTRSCGGTTAFCSTMVNNPTLTAFTCPYSYNYCGASSSELELHPVTRNNLKIEISNYLFQDPETCYYEFYAKNSNLPNQEYMRYFFDLEITIREDVVIQLNNGTDLFAANDPITVSVDTGSRFQYTAENNRVWISFAASGSDPAFGIVAKLRSFDTRPWEERFPPEPEPEPTPDPEPVIDPEPTVDPEPTTDPEDTTPTTDPTDGETTPVDENAPDTLTPTDDTTSTDDGSSTPTTTPDDQTDSTPATGDTTDDSTDTGSGAVTNTDGTADTGTGTTDTSTTDGESQEAGSANLIPDDGAFTEVTVINLEPIIIEQFEYVTIKVPVQKPTQDQDPIIVEEIVYVEPEVVEEEPKPRKTQRGLDVLTGVTVLGIITYLVCHGCIKCRQQQQHKKKVAQENAGVTIEVGKWHDIVTPPEDSQEHPLEKSGSGESLAKGDSNNSDEQEESQGGPSFGGNHLRVIDVSNLDGDSAMGDSQHGLMGAQMGGSQHDDDFFDDAKKNRKMKISDAIEDNDAGFKKGVAKKKKKKGGKGKNDKADDGNMLGFSQPNNGINNESWDSSRGQAKVVDLSSQTPAGVTPAGNRNINKRSSGAYGNGSAMNEYYAGTPAGGLSNNPSAQQLSVHNAMNDIEEAVDLSNRGSRESLHQYGGGFDQATNMVQNNRLGMTMQQNKNNLGLGSHSAMATSFQARPIATSTSNMMHHNPNNDNGFLGTDGNMVVRASHNSKLSKGSLSSVNQTNPNHF